MDFFLFRFGFLKNRIRFGMSFVRFGSDIIHRVQNKRSTDFFAVTFTNIDRFS